jgi:Tfp pilus assembly protein PilE
MLEIIVYVAVLALVAFGIYVLYKMVSEKKSASAAATDAATHLENVAKREVAKVAVQTANVVSQTATQAANSVVQAVSTNTTPTSK